MNTLVAGLEPVYTIHVTSEVVTVGQGVDAPLPLKFSKC